MSIYEAASNLDKSSQVLKRAGLQDLQPAPEIFDGDRTQSYLQHFVKNRGIFLNMLYLHVVDNFLTYVSEIIGLIYRTKPETMKTGGQVKLDFVLSHQSMNEFIDALAEKQVHDLTYMSIRDLNEYLSDRLNFSLVEDEKELAYLAEIVDIRNLLSHNRGAINALFVSRQPQYASMLGQTIEISAKKLPEDLKVLVRVVKNIDLRAINKFSLPEFHGDKPSDQ
jgi:hypothetical protein